MFDKKAYEVYDSSMLIGYVGEGPGPFITTAHSALPYTMLEQVRYTSLSFKHERVVDRIIFDARSLAAAVKGLTAKGLRLVEVEHDKVFLPPEKTPRMDPLARERTDLLRGRKR